MNQMNVKFFQFWRPKCPCILFLFPPFWLDYFDHWGVQMKKPTSEVTPVMISTVYPGISEMTTDSIIQSNKQSAEVTFTCSATGKPTPTIEWEPSTPDLPSSQSATTTQTNGDSTFTSTRNISVQVPPDWSGYVDCVVNVGMVGERRKRIPLTLNPGKKDKDKCTYGKMCSGKFCCIFGVLVKVQGILQSWFITGRIIMWHM